MANVDNRQCAVAFRRQLLIKLQTTETEYNDNCCTKYLGLLALAGSQGIAREMLYHLRESVMQLHLRFPSVG